LIGISIALFAVVFIWSRTFISEQVLKFNEPIEDYCNSVSLDIDVSKQEGDTLQFSLSNIGNVNVYQIQVDYLYEGGKTTQFYSASGIENQDIALSAGKAVTFTVMQPSEITIQSLEITPLLLGEGKDTGKPFAFPCENAKKTFTI